MIDRSKPYSMPGTFSLDLPAAEGRRSYRIFLSVPKDPPPPDGWPLLILTDGNATFPFAATSLATQAPYPRATNVGWGVIAAIGYPIDEPYDGLRRSWDLTPPPGRSYPPFTEGGPAVMTGGASDFLSFIETRLLPKVVEIVAVDVTRRALFGHSFGGLFTLYALFNRPSLFSTWIAASPTIYWEDSVILNSEAERQKASSAMSFLHLSAGAFEGEELAPFQYLNDDAAERLEKRKLERTVSLAKEMARRLGTAVDGLRTEFELYAGETHMSVLAAAVNRAVGIAFTPRL